MHRRKPGSTTPTPRDITESKVYKLWYARPRPLQHNRLRFFARLRSCELACPRCGWITRFGPTSKGTNQCYDAKRSVWTCPSCRLRLILGVAAWTITPGQAKTSTTPSDQLPTLAEARLLRWAFPDWHHGLVDAAEALGRKGRGAAGESLKALENVRQGLHSRAKGAAAQWAAWGAALFGALTTVRGEVGGRRGRLANSLVDGEEEPGPGVRVLRAELEEALPEDPQEPVENSPEPPETESAE